MPKFLVKLADNEYVEWSTVVDAPLTPIMDREQALEHSYRGIRGGREVERRVYAAERVDRTDRNNHSALWLDPEPVEEIIAGNRAGEGETELTLEQLRSEGRA
jgi:hypothetical protein